MSQYYLGIEVSGNTLKVAAFQKTGAKFKIKSLDTLSFAKGFGNAKEDLFPWIKEHFPQGSNVTAIVSLSESNLFLREMVLPKLSKNQIEEAVKWEVLGSTPFPKDDVVLDWKELEKTKEGTRVLAFCAKESSISEVVSLLEAVGIKVLAVEPSTLSFERVSGTDLKNTTLLITVGNEETNLTILKKKSPVFTTSLTTPILPDDEVKRRLSASVIEDLAAQADKTIFYWESKNDEKVKQAVITGDIAHKYYGLASAIHDKSNIAAFMAVMKKSKDIVIPESFSTILLRYSISVGAVYRFVEGVETVNLLPKDRRLTVLKDRSQVKLRKVSLVMLLSNAIILSALLLSLIFLALWHNSMKNEESQKMLEVQNHPAQQMLASVNETNSNVALIESLAKKQKNTGDRLNTIARLTPKSVKLTNIDFGQVENEEWKITGEAKRSDILSYYDKLVESAGAKKVEMPYSNVEKDETHEFEIKIIW